MLHRISPIAATLAISLLSVPALGQTGVDDDRVSLPEGPGSLEGVGDNVEIDPNMGSMRYTVPILAPTGRLGMAPEIGLSYSSSAPAGPLGVGWSMPSPSIERMTSRGVPDYDTDDFFAFDGGDELVQTGTAGQDLVYRSRFENGFRRHTWVDPDSGQGGYWKVEFPDGNIGYYGATQDGTLVPSARLEDGAGRVAEYKLVEMVDPFGNRVLYEYDALTSNVPLLSTISWVFTNDTPLYTATITYEARPDPISDANTGFETVLEHRVSSFEIRHEGQIVREYGMVYEAEMASGGLSRLERVRHWGVGGQAGGTENPIQFSFAYQKGLGVECTDAGCSKPYLVDMGSVGVALGSGLATLIDINGDSLPDVLDTSQTGAKHRFILNQLEAQADGSFRHTFGGSLESSIDQSTSFQLGDRVQTLDVNGDGYSDLVNTATGAFLLKDPDADDWITPGASLDIAPLVGTDFATARFFDYDNDKKIDVLVSTVSNTQVIVNDGSSFTTTSSGVDAIGVPFDGGTLQMSDINGDGMTDPVELVPGSGLFRYRLNLGKGRFSAWRNLSGPVIQPSEQDLVDLEDLNGDGRDDVVIVTTGQVKYAVNRGDRFDPFVTVDNVDGGIPARVDGTTVLYADMNANGSEDIVWFEASGNVKYLELFPERPNLLSRTDNGLGFVQKVTYGTAAEQAALAARDGAPWEHPLQIPMAVVTATDNFVTLTGDDAGTGLQDIVNYRYRDAFYDGVEKQYRGFETVTIDTVASDAQEPGRRIQVFDLGRDDVYFNGLELSNTVFSQDRELQATTNTYAYCPLDASVPDIQGRFAVKHVCLTQTDVIAKEGLAESSWETTRATMEYDAFGNVTKEVLSGLLSVEGDEMTTETTYAAPGTKWFVNLPVTTSTYVDPAGDRTEVQYYYDGTNFDGVQSDIQTGFLSRQTTRADADTVLETLRAKPDPYGNSVETLDPNGDPDVTTRHRRAYTYDRYGLLLARTQLFNETPAGEPYSLVRDSRFDYRFQKVSSLQDWIVVQDDTPLTPTNVTSIGYDDLGREVSRQLPGDLDGMPSTVATYELGDPFSRIIIRGRSIPGGAQDREILKCLDGQGREYQTRTRLETGRYLVTGFNVYNARGAVVATYQPYESNSGACEAGAPQGGRAERTRFDALFRPTERTSPDAGIYATASAQRWVYEPNLELFYDEEDTVEGGKHEGTPLIRRRDGLDRVVELQRSWTEGGAMQTASYKMFFDNTGSFAGYEDPQGNRQEQSVDLAGRITSVTNPNFGALSMTYDAAGNVLTHTEARGITFENTYDGLNRLVERVVPGQDATRVTLTYDFAPGCAVTDCTQPANRLALVDYQLADGLPGQMRYGYDNRGRQITQIQRYGDIDLTSRMTYNSQDVPVSVTYPDGTALEYRRDGAERDIGVPGYLDAMTYDGSGMLSGIDYANGATSRLTYDDMLRPATLEHKDATGQILERYVMSRDRLGNLTELLDDASRDDLPDASLTLSYDDWYRLEQANTFHADGQAETLTYTYDTLDNVTSLTSTLEDMSPTHVGALVYDAMRPNQVTDAGGLAMAYDARGQMTARGEATFAWDDQGRMTQAGAAQYWYGLDQMQLGTRTEDGLVFYGPGDFEVRDGISHAYIRVNQNRLGRSQSTALQLTLYPDVDTDGEITAADAFALAQGASAEGGLDAVSTPLHVLGAAAARLIAEEEDDKAFLHVDYLGSVTIATDEGGVVRGQRAFYPTGVMRWQDGHVDPYGFTGQEHMDSGLVRFQFRHLDPRTARWVSFDPLFMMMDSAEPMEKLGEATTGYAYVSNSFHNFTDPLGLNENPQGEGQRSQNHPDSGRRQSAGPEGDRSDINTPVRDSSSNTAAAAEVDDENDNAGGNDLLGGGGNDPVAGGNPLLGGNPNNGEAPDLLGADFGNVGNLRQNNNNQVGGNGPVNDQGEPGGRFTRNQVRAAKVGAAVTVLAVVGTAIAFIGDAAGAWEL